MLGSASLLLLLPLLATELWAAPLTKYDQKQDGEFNVHAHLENFVILLIPGGGGGLLNIAAKIAPSKHHGGKHVKSTAEGGVRHPGEETSVAVPVGLKAPPYKVDIDADRRTPIVLQITAPRVGEEQHEVVIAESPTVSITKAQAPVQKEADKPVEAVPQPEEPARAEDKPPKAEDKPSEPSEKPQDSPAPSPVPAKTEPAPAPALAPVASPVEKPIRKQASAPAATAVAAAPVPAPAATDQKEAAAAGEAERPAEPAKPAAAAPAPAPAAAAAPAPAGEQPPPSSPPPKQVAQEARSRAARLEVLRTGLVPSPAGPCAPHEVRDGRCARALEPARVTKNFEDAMLLKALRFGLAPAH